MTEPTESSSGIILELISYNTEQYDKYTDQPIDKLVELINPDAISWINVDGLEDGHILEKIQSHFNLHSLLIEDVLSDQRPMTEDYEDYLYFTLKMLYRIENKNIEYEQISFVLGRDYLISFQEKEGDFFDPFRERIKRGLGRVRKQKADYLLYRLIDIIVDKYYDILENFGNLIEDVEDTLLDDPTPQAFSRIQQLKKDLIYLRKAISPLRDAFNKLIKDESHLIEDDTMRFFSDLHNRVIHLSDSIETYNDLVSGLMDMYYQTQNNKLNELIRFLTIMSSIFIPLTFVAGLYGMNFEFMPELHWHYGYLSAWVAIILITVGMIFYFKRKKWL